jgi:hypothetical protein
MQELFFVMADALVALVAQGSLPGLSHFRILWAASLISDI